MKDENKERAEELADFLRALCRSEYGPSDRREYVLLEQQKGTSHHTGMTLNGTIPTRYKPTDLYDGRGAVQAISEGTVGMVMYWGDRAAGTAEMVCVDIDDPTLREKLPCSLEILSGSGNWHRIYHNNGSVRNYWLAGQSKVNADPNGPKTSYTVLPGSKHEDTGTPYRVNHVPKGEPLTTLSDSDLPDALRP